MSELIAAVIGALIGSATTILWETFLKPRRERTSIAAAINAEVAFIFLTVHRHVDRAEQHVIPIDFHGPTTVYQSLSGRLGELPPDLSFLLATLYSALEEANALPGHYRNTLQHREGEGGQLTRIERHRLVTRFNQLLKTVEGTARLAHSGLSKVAPGVTVEIARRDE